MDISLLSRLTRAVDERSRRHALRTALGGITLAAAGLVAAAPPSKAKKNNRKNKRKKKKTCPDCPVCQNCPTCPPQCVGKALGDACQNIKECCGNETNLSCGLTDGGGSDTVCCGTLGAPCVGDADCCLPFFCPGPGELWMSVSARSSP